MHQILICINVDDAVMEEIGSMIKPDIFFTFYMIVSVLVYKKIAIY